MFLKKIILKNFRQFYGEQEIVFSVDPKKNVTLIHAENGVGKTTLLNALLWCFYKELTARFEEQDKIVSNQAVEEDDFEASVEVFFEHDGDDYYVKRKINEKFSNEQQFDAYLIEKGSYKPLPTPSAFVESVVPQEMSGYFFFDGEYAETFSSKKNKKVVQKAVESMLGCNTAAQADSDLKAIKKSLEKEIAGLTKNNEAKAFQDLINNLEKQQEADAADIIVLDDNLEVAHTAVEEISKKLRNSEGAKEIQQKRDRLEKQKETAEAKKEKVKAKRVRWIDKFSTGLLSSKVSAACADIIEDANIKRQIPSKIAETFVKDILQESVCICDRHFEAGSKEETAIKTLLPEAGKAIVGDRLMLIQERIGRLKQSKDVAFQEFQDTSTELENLNAEIDDCEAQIKECGVQLKDSNVREIAEREQALERRLKEIEELTEQKGRLKQKCEDREGKIKEHTKSRNKRFQGNKRAEGIQKQVKLLDATIERLEKELDKYREESRKIIIEKVNNILQETARRDYFAEIDESFNLDMFYGETTTAVAKSGGENQLLSLAFIASLVSFAADRREEAKQLLKPGTMAPLMLDSPFGQLDPSYRKSTAQFLPTLAGQVVLLVSKTQGDDDVIDALGEKIGSEYVLVSEVRSTQGDKPSDVIELHGEQIACSLYEREKNRTRIKKVARGK